MRRSNFQFAIFNLQFAILLLSLVLAPVASQSDEIGPGEVVRVEIVEGIPEKRSWDFTLPEATEHYTAEAFGFVVLPKKYSERAIVMDRSNPFLVRAAATVELPGGEYRLLLRAKNATRLFLDDERLLETDFVKGNASGHEAVPDAPAVTNESLHPLPIGHQERVTTIKLDGESHHFRLESFVGGQKLRMELGELLVAVAAPGEPFRLLTPMDKRIGMSENDWPAYDAASRDRMKRHDAATRATVGGEETRYWQMRHDLARREWSNRPALVVPEVGGKTPVQNAIDRFIGQRLEERGVAATPRTDDLAFLRRVSLDTVGVIPTPAEIESFLRDDAATRRARAIDRLLADSRWADHWVGYWQDVLAENPGILKPTLNNTGPFRWWIHQALEDNLPMDRFVTELVMMEGSTMYGGPAGFAMASLNDAPMAAKAHVAAKAFLGIELQCARCHDAPFHPYKQKELFSLAAMLGKGPQKVPTTSTVPRAERSRRPLVAVTLEPGAKVDPAWPFVDLAPAEFPPGVLRDPENPRERFAALLTSPHNLRFAEVLVNRLWKRTMGIGIVEPVDDWAGAEPSHPELLEFLGRELITHDYDFKHVAQLILNSHTYQRAAQSGGESPKDPADRLFAGPARRRMTAEQLVDSLFLAAGKEFRSEELCLDVDGRRPITEFLNLGTPRRAWEFTSLSNERDRPALALPVAQSIVDLLTAYGWRESRQNPITVRDETATPLQPLVLANGVVGNRITRLSDDSAITALCLADRPLPELVRAVHRQVLSRDPSDRELDMFVELLGEGYDARRKAGTENRTVRQVAKASAVSWSNHLSPEATRLKLEQERAARAGDPPTERLTSDWRERMEDMLWSLVNSPEFVFVP